MNKEKILITGAGSGLGKEAALALARRGHTVYATARYDTEVDKLKKQAKDENIDLRSFKLDILLDEDRNKLLNIDFNILVNNAAIGDSGSVSEIRVDRFENVFETNVFSNIKITQIALKKLIEEKKGKVIFVSSLFGRISYPFLAPYCASKFAIEAFASSLRKELKGLDGTNIQVGIIEPGAYATGFNKENNDKKFEWMQRESYFRYKWQDIKEKEEKIFNFLERKKFDTIINQYIKAVECNKLKHRYTAPKSQAFFIQLGRIFGM